MLGTGDFTHPAWFREIQQKLVPAEPGLYRLKPEYVTRDQAYPTIEAGETRFLLSVEISSIYSRDGKTRRVHNCILAPSVSVVEKVNTHLGWIGNLKADGRPILGLDSEELANIVFGISEECAIIPAHAWTPWFSVFGSMSGFDSLEECFGAYTGKIWGIETGLSSDPAMNRLVSRLDGVSLISNSDSHSLTRIGREANIIESDLAYAGILSALRSNTPGRFRATIEFFPEEGKYHLDGHRKCGVRMNPDETKRSNAICPQCGKGVTVGVLHRVLDLADRKEPLVGIPFYNLIPLDQVIADVLHVGVETRAVTEEYRKIVTALGNECTVLLESPRERLEEVTSREIAEGIFRVREKKVSIDPGYDGEYGKIHIIGENELASAEQASLFG